MTFLRIAAGALLAFLGAATPGFAASSFSLSDVVIDSGGTTYRAKQVEITDSPLSQDEVRALLADTSLPAPQRWAKITATRITAPEIVSETNAGGTAQAVTYRDLVFEDVVEGRIGRARASGATVVIKGRETGDIAARTGSVALDGIDLPAFAHIMAEGRTSPDETSRTVVREGTITDVVLELPGGATGRIGSVALRDAGGRALAVPMASLVDLAPRPNDDPPSPERRRALSGLFADLLTSQSIGRLAFKDIAVTAPPAQGTSVAVSGFTLDSVRSGRIATVALDGLSITDKAGVKVTAGRFAANGLDFTPLLAAALTSAAPRVPIRFDQLQADALSATVPGNGQPLVLAIERGAIDAKDWVLSAPRDVAVRIDRFAFDLPTDDPKFRPLLDMGYGRVDVSLATQSVYDETRSELTLKNFTVTGKDVGTLDLSALLSNIGPGLLSSDSATAYAAITGGLFRRATAAVTDAGLLERLIATQARQTNASAADVRARWAASARAAATAFLADNPDRGKVADALERFIRSGGRVSVAADAQTGLGVIDAMLAGGVQGLLGKVKITAGN